MAITNHSCSSVNSNNIFPCEMQTHLSSIFSELTLRECEVLYWFAIGCTIDHIAELMGLKPRTVTYHLDFTTGDFFFIGFTISTLYF